MKKIFIKVLELLSQLLTFIVLIVIPMHAALGILLYRFNIIDSDDMTTPLLIIIVMLYTVLLVKTSWKIIK